MDKSMLGKISRLIKQVPSKSLGTLYDLLKKLASKDGEAWLEALKQFLRQELEVVDKGLGGIFSTKRLLAKRCISQRCLLFPKPCHGTSSLRFSNQPARTIAHA